MCELLIRTENNGDSPRITQRGDLIDAQADGFGWGTKEFDLPIWKIVGLPGVPASNFADMLRPQVLDFPEKDTMVSARVFYFALDSIPAVLLRMNIEPSVVMLTSTEQNDLLASKTMRPSPRVTVG